MRSAIMSSIAMAADSTQADIVHHRAKASVHRTGTRGTHLLQEDYSRSKHSYLSRHIRQTKSCRKLQNRSKTGARQSIIHDDCSDHDSDLDLSKDLLPISGYARIEDEMVDHMFRSISNRKLRAMLPEILKPLGTNDLKKLCIEQLEVMSKKRICCILDGADPDTISSSGTEEDDFYEDENSRHSTDIETEGKDVVSASAESEAVGSTSFYEADAVKLRSTQERCMTDNDGCNETSSEKKELFLEEAERARVSDQEENNKEENVETHKSKDDLVFHSISKEVKHYEYENEHPMFKLCEGKYVEECVSDEISRDETIKQGRSVAERCYRTKQLDDDDHENLYSGRRPPEEIRDTCDQNNEGAEIINKGFLDACQPKDDHVLDNDCISDVGSIPSSLPGLESEPEETCLPLQILDSNFVNAGGPATTLESTHTLLQLSVQMAPGIAGLDSEFSTRNCQDKPVSCTSDELDVLKTSNVCKVVSANSQMKIDDFNATMSKRSPVASVGSKSAELAAESEEMIIEVQDHEFSDEFEDAFGCGVKASNSKELPQKMYKQSLATGMKALYHEEVVQEMGFDKQSLDLSKSHSLQKQRLLEDVAKSEKMDTEEIHSIDKVSESKELKRKLFEKSEVNYILPKSSKVFCQNVFVGKGQTRLILEQKKSCIIIDKSESSGNIPVFNSDIVLEKPCLTDLSDAADICFEKCGSLQENQTPQTNSTESGCIAGFKYSCNSEELKAEQLSIVKVVLVDGSAEEAQLSFEADNEEPMCQKSDSENLQIEVSHKRETAIQSQSKTVSPCPKTTTEDNGIVMDSVPALSKTQLEILELEMRARAIKAMLKAQEELERREEKLKFEDKYHLVPQVTSQTARSSQSSEHHRVLSEEKKELQPVAYQRLSTFAVESGNAQGEKKRIIQNSIHTQKYKTAQLVKRQPQTAAAGMSNDMAQTMLSRQSCNRLPVKSCQEVMKSSKLVTSNLIKRPVTVATRGKAASGSSLTSFGSGSRRIVRLSSEKRTADSRTVVHRPNAFSSRAVTSEKISKPVMYNRTDTRRVIATSCNSQVSRMTYDTVRYGYRDREHRSPAREQSRSVVTWQRQTVIPKEGFRGNRV